VEAHRVLRRRESHIFLTVCSRQSYAPAALYPPRKIPGTHFCWRLNRPQDHSAAERISSIKKEIQLIYWESNTDLPACVIVPHPITLPRVLNIVTCYLLTHRIICGLRILYLNLLDIHQAVFTITYNISNYIT
jgi:hypothetical protein